MSSLSDRNVVSSTCSGSEYCDMILCSYMQHRSRLAHVFVKAAYADGTVTAVQRDILQRAYRDEQGHLGSTRGVGLALYGDLLTAAYLSALCSLPRPLVDTFSASDCPASTASINTSQLSGSTAAGLAKPVHEISQAPKRERCVGFYAHEDELGSFGKMQELQLLSERQLQKRLKATRLFHGLGVPFANGMIHWRALVWIHKRLFFVATQ
jgi:hypothetical protein